MTDTTIDDSAHRQPDIEHFLNLNTVLHSLVDFVRPETYIAQDELETYNEFKEKFLRQSTAKRNKSQGQNGEQTNLAIAGVQSIRTTSGIYQFLARHHKDKTSIANSHQHTINPISRDELLNKLHQKMPHRQHQAETGVDQTAKRKRTKDISKDREKKPRTAIKEWSSPATSSKPPVESATPVVTPHITFGRFEFNTGDTPDKRLKKKGLKKFQSKEKQLKNTLKQIESEKDELNRVREENPDQGKELLRSKHWQTALAKAKGEKIRDNVQLLRKTIKKEHKRRERSAKKWQDNKSQTDKRMKEKQDKRQTNIQKRKDEKKAKIKKKLIKKGRLIS